MCKSTLDEKEVYQKLVGFGKSKDASDALIPKVAEYINHPSKKVKAKVLWMLGELGLKNSKKITSYVDSIVKELENDDAKIRERAVGALGRIGRGNFGLVEPYISMILSKASDPHPDVRMNCIWACENIATNTPDVFASSMDDFCRIFR